MELILSNNNLNSKRVDNNYPNLKKKKRKRKKEIVNKKIILRLFLKFSQTK